MSSSSLGAVKPPWIGIFPVNTPAHIIRGSDRGDDRDKQTNQGSQLLFETEVHSPPVARQNSSHHSPQLFIVMQEVPTETVLTEESTTIPSATVVPSDVKSETPMPSSATSGSVDKIFDISLIKLDHIAAAFHSSERMQAREDDNNGDIDPLEQFLDRGWNGKGLSEQNKPSKNSCSAADQIQLPICIVWRGRTSLSKMCPIEIQQALTVASKSETLSFGFLGAYRVLVEEILMNRVKSKASSVLGNTSSLADSVADEIVAEVNEIASRQRTHTTCKRQEEVVSGDAAIDPLFHLKSEVEEDNHAPERGEGEGFVDFLRDHGLPLPAGSSSIDEPLTTLLKHAYGFARMSRSTPKVETATSKLAAELPLKRSISSTIVASSPSPIQESIMAMRRHRYAYLKNTLGIIGDSRAGEGGSSSHPGLIFNVSPQEILHTSLQKYQGSSEKSSSEVIPSVVSIEIRIAAIDGERGGGGFSHSNQKHREESPSSPPPSYLPFATMHCFLDDSHKHQLSSRGADTRSGNVDKGSYIHQKRHPLAGFLNMLCGAFLHHNQLSEEIIPTLLMTQKNLLTSCFFPLANSSLEREADLLAAFEEILNSKKSKIRELVDHGRRSQRRVEDLEGLVTHLKDRLLTLETSNVVQQQSQEDTESPLEIFVEDSNAKIRLEVTSDEKKISPDRQPSPPNTRNKPITGNKREREITDDWLVDEAPPRNADDETLSLLN